MRASISGNQEESCFICLRASKKIEGRWDFRRAFSSSPITRSFESEETSILSEISAVSSSIDNSNLAANCAALKTLRGSSAKEAGFTQRSNPFFKSSRPPQKSSISPVNTSCIIALMVKSLREEAFSGPMKGSTDMLKSLCPFPVADSERGIAMSIS